MWILLSSPLYSPTGLDEGDLIYLINWGLKRQTTHAALSLSALLGLFSILRLKKEKLQMCETFLAFFGFISFLSYEYYKLIRSFNMIYIYEHWLPIYEINPNLFLLDPFQDWFFKHSMVQVLLISIVIFIMYRMYIESSNYILINNLTSND